MGNPSSGGFGVNALRCRYLRSPRLAIILAGRFREGGDHGDARPDARIRFQDKPRLSGHTRTLATAGARQIQRRDHCRQHQRPPPLRDAASAGLLLSAIGRALRSDDPDGSSHLLPLQGDSVVLDDCGRRQGGGKRGVGLFGPLRGGGGAVDSSPSVEIVVGGKVIAETRRARFLFETRLPTRYYIPPEDVQMELLVPSEKVTACPYKGRSRYYSVKVEDRLFSDLVWTYPDPIPECPKIKGYLCFFNEHVDEIRVDGVSVPRPLTPWSKDWKEKAATVPD